MTLQSSLSLPSEIRRILIYARGAQVTRRVSLPPDLPEEEVTLQIEGVSSSALTGSFRAATTGGDRWVLGLETEIIHPRSPEPPEDLKAREENLERKFEELKARHLLVSQHHHNLLKHQMTVEESQERLRKGAAQRIFDALVVVDLLDELGELEERALDRLEEEAEEVEEELRFVRAERRRVSGENVQSNVELGVRVNIHLGAGSVLPEALEFSYDVEAARWWPAYTVRLEEGAAEGEWSIGAFVAQLTGEDWDGVELSLCTADRTREVRLPELPSLRLGRCQEEHARGFRALPNDLDSLFEGYDASWSAGKSGSDRVDLPAAFRSLRAADGAPSLEPPRPAKPLETLSSPVPQAQTPLLSVPVGAERHRAAPKAAMPGVGLFTKKRSARRDLFMEDEEADASVLMADDDGFGEEDLAASELPVEHGLKDEWLDFSRLCLRAPADAGHAGRGRLENKRPSQDPQRSSRREAMDALEAPFSCQDPLYSRGAFDHTYRAEGFCDLKASGKPQRVDLLKAEASCAPRFFAVTRQEEEVYREMELTNPFDAPLLAGPVDVFVNGALLRTSPMASVDRGGKIRLGLGLEERIRIARNARAEESTRGLLGGNVVVEQSVSIEVRSTLGFDAQVVVVDRIPVAGDKECEIKLIRASPPSSPYTQKDRDCPVEGGLSWTLELPASGFREISFSYTVEMSSKLELQGGNRRD